MLAPCPRIFCASSAFFACADFAHVVGSLYGNGQRPTVRNRQMTSKYAEIIARRKADREAENDDKPLRFKLVKTADGGTTLIRV